VIRVDKGFRLPHQYRYVFKFVLLNRLFFSVVFYRLLFVLQLTQLTRNSCHKGNEEQKIPHRQKGSKIQSKITETETAPTVTHK
jgi:hypothetical protein